MSPPSAYRSAHTLSAAKPTRKLFDPWNSSSTGHQRAENRLSGSTSWRDSRTAKLGEQFKDGRSGGRRMADSVGAGSEGFIFDGRKENGAWVRGAKGLSKIGQRSVVGYGATYAKESTVTLAVEETAESHRRPTSVSQQQQLQGRIKTVSEESEDGVQLLPLNSKARRESEEQGGNTKHAQPPQIFRGLTIYINGSTYPIVSDHKLKQLLASHGARISVALGRRTVTHVILGRPNGSTSASGCHGAGGGLAGGKLQREISKVGGNSLKFVGPEWVLQSISAGKRLPEARFANLKVANRGQSSAFDVIGRRVTDTGLEH